MIYIFLLMLAGTIGAKTQIMSRDGASIVWPFASGILAIGVWSFMTKSNMSPWVTAIVFDGIYGLSWLFTLYMLGERPTLMAILGALLVLTGLLLTSVP